MKPPRIFAPIAMNLAALATLVASPDTVAADRLASDVQPGLANGGVEQAYQELLRLSRMPSSSTVAAYDINNRLRESGLAFLEKFPADPRRWDVIAWMDRAVFIGREVVDEKGAVRKERDVEAHRKWSEEYRLMATEVLAAPDASAEARQQVLGYFIRDHAFLVNEKRTPNPRENVAIMTGHIVELRKYPPSMRLLSAYRDYARSLGTVDPMACLKFLREIPQHHVSTGSVDQQIRDFAAAHLRLLEAEAMPVWAQLASIDARFAKVNHASGNVVLIAFAGLKSEPFETWMVDLHKKFQQQGLEIVQVSPGSRDVARITGIPGSVATRAPSWVVMDNDGVMMKFYERFGLNTIPGWLIVARDGKFITDVTSRTLATVIEREMTLLETK